MIEVLELIANKIWIFITFLIFISGIYFTFKLKGIQFNFKRMFKEIFKKDNSSKGLSSLNTLLLALAARIGVGSIAGVTLAIYLGGEGSIFWIWVLSFISVTLSYCETYLGVKYKQKDEKSINKGGPQYYIKDGLNKPKLGAIYALVIIVAYIAGFILIQSNTITKSITSLFNVNGAIIGLILCFITFIIIFGGVKKISEANNKIVPVMSIIYIAISIIVLIMNINNIPSVIKRIFSSAFNFKSFTSGFLATMIMGVQKGVFSNEAGMGTGSIAASSGNSNDPIKEGYVQMLGIYIASIIICTATSIIILNTNYNILNIIDPNGIEIAQYAFNYHFGTLGNIILLICIFLFAFSTILTGYYYGESSLKYFTNKNNKKIIFILKLLCLASVFIGSITSPSLIWVLTDFFVAILALINIYAIFKLRNEIKK